MHVLIPALHRPTKPTGVCRHAVNLAQCLVEVDQVRCVTIVIGQWQHDYFQQSFAIDSPKIHLATINVENSSLSRNRWFVFGLPKLVRKLQPDIVHLSFPFPFVRRWFQVPVVATIHDLYPYECPENFGYPRVWFNQLFLKQCIRSSSGLACVSQCTLDTLQTYFPQVKKNQNIAVIYNIVDFGNTTSTTPQQLGSSFSHLS